MSNKTDLIIGQDYSWIEHWQLDRSRYRRVDEPPCLDDILRFLQGADIRVWSVPQDGKVQMSRGGSGEAREHYPVLTIASEDVPAAACLLTFDEPVRAGTQGTIVPLTAAQLESVAIHVDELIRWQGRHVVSTIQLSRDSGQARS